ncbi:MAG: metal-dependent hydrolase [Pseudomonadota bacterium]
MTISAVKRHGVHQLDIVVRRIPFVLHEGIDPVWNPGKREWSHMVNGASLTMPYLEPFLIKTMREALPHINDDRLRAEAQGFVEQEAQHYQNHRRYNDMLKSKGYDVLAQVEEGYREEYAALSKRSLHWKLAYSAGFETMTIGMTEWLIRGRQKLFQNADPMVTSFVLWHMVEETEHKSVAIDVYRACFDDYLVRVAGLFWGSLHVALLARRAYTAMLKADGVWGNWRSRLRLYRMVASFFANATPAMARALVPGYHPQRVPDPAWAELWGDHYKRLKEGEIPLLNTSDSEIPPVFVARAA